MIKLTYDERVELCRQMLREHCPWNKIGRKTGFGPNQISKINKDMLGIDGSPKHTQAYALFKGGKSNYEVAQELDLTEEQTTKYKRLFEMDWTRQTRGIL
jgi:hypothetical protein